MITWKKFHPGKAGSRFAGTKFSHVIASARQNIHRSTFQLSEDISIVFLRRYDVNLWEKKLRNIFVQFHYFTEAPTGWVLQERCS